MATNASPKYQLQWKNLGKNQNIHGYCYSGELFAFLGKIDEKSNILTSIAYPESNEPTLSTNDLLDQSYYQIDNEKESTITLNNEKLSHSLDNFSYIDINYVNQMYYSLTVIETLIFSSELRNKTSQPLVTKELAALRLLTEIGLKDIADTLISNLKIWQCRLVLLAIEIVAMKDILFFHEPSSDLDATSALLLLNGLQRIARRNYIIIITASSLTFREYAILDRIQLLSNDGAIYFGFSANALTYFKNLNRTPAPGTSISDFLLDLVDDIITGGKNDMKNLEKICEKNGLSCPSFQPLANDIKKYSKRHRYIDRYMDNNTTIDIENDFKNIITNDNNNNENFMKYCESIYNTWLWLINCDCCELNDEDECNFSTQPLIVKQFIWLLWRSMIIRYR